MDQPVELVPLLCLKCSTPIPASADESAWVCAQCGQGMLLDPKIGLVPLDVHYAAGILPNTPGKPYWVADGQVTLSRESYGSGGKEGREAELFWSQPRRFFLPAFAASLEALLSQAIQMLLQPPPLQNGPAARFESVTASVEDVQPAAEFIVMAIEAGRKDKAKKIDFALKLSHPELWILP